jgi:hypothetical protein
MDFCECVDDVDDNPLQYNCFIWRFLIVDCQNDYMLFQDGVFSC